jgi:RNA polymerase sigma-70 factor (sigma-E family)
VVDESEFAEFVSARWMNLVRTAVLLGAGREEAEDLAQATFVKCFRSWSRVVGADHPDSYVYRILLNSFRQSRRRRWWREWPTAELPEQVAPDEMAVVDEADAVARALDRLARDHRDVVVLRYFVHLSESEAADALGIPLGTAKSRLSRALSQLAADPGLVETRERTN